MRLLVRDFTDNTLCLFKMQNVVLKNYVESEGVANNIDCALAFTDDFDNRIYVVLPLDVCESIMYDLLRDDYADLSMYMKDTYIFPEPAETERLQELYEVVEV